MTESLISQETHRARLEKAREIMRTEGIDLLLIGPSSDLFYLIGFDAHISERLNLLGLPLEGRPFLVLPLLEAPNAASVQDLVDIHAWGETISPTNLAGRLAGDMTGKVAAVSDQLWSGFLLKLQNEMPGASWQSALPVMKPLRLTKDETEIDLLAKAAHLTDLAWHEFIEGTTLTGLTETQALQQLKELTEKQGLSVGWGICASGPNSAAPHYHTGDRVIEKGDVVVFDWGGSIGGYNSDVTRTVVVGEPTEEFRKVYDIVKRANQATFEAVKPGVPLEDLDAAARDLITAEGYGDYFIHRVGHGLGLDVHEEPYLVNGNTDPLEPGMSFSDEPGIYIPGSFGVRIEDTVVCTEHGARRLNEATRELTVMD